MADKTITLGVADYRLSRFEHGVEGVEAIRSAHDGGTEIPTPKEEEVREAAKAAGIKLRKL